MVVTVSSAHTFAIMATETVERVIKRALRLVQVLEPGEEPEEFQYEDGIEALNDMLISWVAEGLLDTEERYGELKSIAGQIEYELGGKDFPVRPTTLKRVRVAIGPVDYPIEMYGSREYLDLPYKFGGYTGRPIGAQYEQRNNIGILRLWPCPEISYPIRFLYDQGAALVGNIGDSIPVPEHWTEAVKYALAVRLAQDYGQQVFPAVAVRAADLEDKMRAASISQDMLEFFPGNDFRGDS